MKAHAGWNICGIIFMHFVQRMHCAPWWWTVVKVMMEMECLCNRWWTWRPSWPMQRKRSTPALQPVTDALPRSGSPVHRSATRWAVTAAPSPRWSCTQSSPSCCQPVRMPPSRSAPQRLWAFFFFAHMRQRVSVWSVLVHLGAWPRFCVGLFVHQLFCWVCLFVSCFVGFVCSSVALLGSFVHQTCLMPSCLWRGTGRDRDPKGVGERRDCT